MCRFVLSMMCVLVVNVSAASGGTLTVLLLGDSTTLCKGSEEGAGYADWVEEFLSKELERKVEVINGGMEGGTVATGRKVLEKYRSSKLDVVVARFGLNDALNLDSEYYVGNYEALIKEASAKFPDVCLIPATSTPVEKGYKHYNEERFRAEGGLDAYLEKHFVEKVRSLAEEKELPIVDQYALLKMALRGEEKTGDLIQPDGVHLTGLGNALAAQNTVCAIFQATGLRKVEPYSRGVYIEPRKLGIRSRPSRKPSKGELQPFLELRGKYVLPLLEKRLKDPASPVRRKALEVLVGEKIFSARFLYLVPDLLKDPDRYVAREASKWIKKVAGAEAVPKLLDMLVEGWQEIELANRILSLLDIYEDEVNFRQRHYDVLMSLLSYGDHRIRSQVLGLVCVNREGVRRVLRELKEYPQGKAGEIMQNYWAHITESLTINKFVWKQIKSWGKPYLTRVCLERLMNHGHGRIPLEIAKYAFTKEAGDLQRSALNVLLHGEEEAVDTLIECLNVEDKMIADSACLSLLDLGLTLDEEKAGVKALAAAKRYLSKGKEDALLFAVSEVFRLRRRFSVPEGLRFSNSIYSSERPRRRSRRRSRRRRGGLAYFYRLKGLVPYLEKMKKHGAKEEKGIAESLLLELWELANAHAVSDTPSRSRRVRRSPREKAGSEYSPSSLEWLKSKYKDEAEEELEAGDMKAFRLGLKRAVALDPSASTYNSFAWKLISSPDASKRNPEKAEKFVRKAIELEGRQAQYLDTLAGCLAGQGKFEKALEIELEAIQKLENYRNAGGYASRAVLYLHKKAVK